jgi:hypothetical protein
MRIAIILMPVRIWIGINIEIRIHIPQDWCHVRLLAGPGSLSGTTQSRVSRECARYDLELDRRRVFEVRLGAVRYRWRVFEVRLGT